jgi:hypothetical protein
MRRIKKRYVGLGILTTLILAFYGCFMHPFHVHAEQAGWSADFSSILLGCPFCRGRVQRLTYNGAAVFAPPQPPADRSSLWTPVGLFESVGGEQQYRAHVVAPTVFPEAGAPLRSAELEAGWFEHTRDGWPPPRRPGTPAGWCLVSVGMRRRWVDPTRLAEQIEVMLQLDAATEAATQAATAPAAGAP